MTTLIPKFDFKNGGLTPDGAINRPIDEKLSDTLSVKDFGAIGDGTTDDTVAIQAAIDAGEFINKAIYFPNGSYLISATLNLPNNITLYGETQRKINDGANTYGVSIKTASNITMMQTTAVLPDFTYGIKIENISFIGNGTTGSALIIGEDIATHLSYGITLRNIDIQSVGNGIKINGAAPMTYLENITMAGTDLAGSYGIYFKRGQIAECHSLKIENFANCYFIQWSADINIYDSTASFNVAGIANGNNLLQMYGAYHCNFYGCVFENLSNSSGAVVEVDIFEYFADPTKSTNNRFYNCTWNGIGTSACRVKIGSTIGDTTEKTYFENCTFRAWGTVSESINFEKSLGSIFVQCYEITGYDGSDNTFPTYIGTDTALQIYNIDGIRFPSTPVPSTNVNTLDAYKEGTWTPALDGGGSGTGVTYSKQTGTYVKVGKTVTLNGEITLSNKGATTGNSAIIGLPFTSDGACNIPVTIIVSPLNSVSYGPIAFGSILAGSTQINLFKMGNGGLNFFTDADMLNNTNFRISVTYIAAT
jgi:hypothetical protein